MPLPIATSNIVKQAFRMMEIAPVSSFADDSEQAQDAAEQYDAAIGFCLEYYDWSFSRALVDLPPAAVPGIADDPDLPFTYVLPSDLLALRFVLPEPIAWRRDGNILRADAAGPVQIRYTRKTTDETTLPQTFQTAASAQLAFLLSPRWVRSRTKRADIAQSVTTYLETAKRNDMQSGSSSRHDGRPRQEDWVSGATR